MELPIVEPGEIPVPPDEVRIRAVVIDIYPDGRRIRVQIELTPFQSPPNLELWVENDKGDRLAHTNIIGATSAAMTLTLHLKAEETLGSHRLWLSLSYEEEGQIERKSYDFEIMEGGDE